MTSTTCGMGHALSSFKQRSISHSQAIHSSLHSSLEVAWLTTKSSKSSFEETTQEVDVAAAIQTNRLLTRSNTKCRCFKTAVDREDSTYTKWSCIRERSTACECGRRIGAFLRLTLIVRKYSYGTWTHRNQSKRKSSCLPAHQTWSLKGTKTRLITHSLGALLPPYSPAEVRTRRSYCGTSRLSFSRKALSTAIHLFSTNNNYRWRMRRQKYQC